MYESLIVIGSEIALSLYPILIKTVPTTLVTQLLSRFLTFTVLAAVLASPSALYQTWGTLKGAARSSGLGLLTLSHVAASYYAFEALPAGVAMSLFYTYPIWNLLGGVLGFGESVTAFQMALVAVAFVGVVLISLGTKEAEDRPVHWKGISAALAAALTETGMYFAVRTAKQENPYFATLELYPGALLGLLGLLAALPLLRGGQQGSQQGPLPPAPAPALDTNPRAWMSMTLFNILIGFIGYTLRFYAIPKVSTITFSLLSFVGVISSFIFGWLFVGERPNLLSSIGALLIAYSSSVI